MYILDDIKTEEMDMDTSTRVEEACTSESITCLICGRQANTGHHYGVTACLGCKTFFRRVVLQGKPPTCKYKNKCHMEKNVNAKRLCRSCRYAKCKEIGMKEEALHPCRDVIGRRRPSVDSTPVSSPNSSIPSIPLKDKGDVNEEDLMFIYGIRDMDTEVRTKTAHLLGKPQPDVNQEIHFYSPKYNYEGVQINNGIGPSLKVDIGLLKEWSGRVPGFSLLSSKYKKHLLRRFCLRYTVTEHGLFTTQMPRNENVWFLSDRTCLVADFVNIPEKIKKYLTPEIIEEQKILAPFTNMLINEVADPLRNLALSSTEVACVKVLMLLKPTCLQEMNGGYLATTEDINLVRNVRNRIINGLHSHYVREGVENVPIRIGEVLMISGGIEVCADRALEEMYLLRIFNMSSFDSTSSEMIFGFSKNFDDR